MQSLYMKQVIQQKTIRAFIDLPHFTQLKIIFKYLVQILFKRIVCACRKNMERLVLRKVDDHT